MKNSEKKKEDKFIEIEAMVIVILSILVPLLLFGLSNYESIPCTSSLDYYRDRCPSYYCIIFGCLAIPFSAITIWGKVYNKALAIFFCSLILAVFCILSIKNITSLAASILLVGTAAIIIILNVIVFIQSSKLEQKDK